jgi:thiol:disulfide interchange protein DsbD
MLGAGASLATAVWLASGLSSPSLGSLEAFLPLPLDAKPTAATPAPLPWHVNDYAAALAQARREHKLVFIDFTGYTCTNCRWMEANMFTRPEIETALGQFVLARLFTDGDGAVYETQQQMQERQFGTVALPMYAIVDGNGATVATLAGLTRDPLAYLKFLQSRS